jgi:hypothetical protein
MRTNRPLVVWSRTETVSLDGEAYLKIEVRYAWRLIGGCPFELQPPADASEWKFVMVIPESFPLSGSVECRVPDCRRYNVGGSEHVHITSGWVIIRTEDVHD